ncbi:hypothetical protein DCC81_23840 [Chitinophaga parva]|uniref:Uncharacterized protein n=1 Tax=Chitinophaga parva TaxID=2169414 RepID=A0A2T7BE98_9BACT|nr:hypothetical protein [Chitinophaga parva]PUZ23413.1 hypothetical protein DCC81_23840 [Chitinophaga parva]
MHTFHIPVMGLAYTIDTPVKVAPFGISSVISIIEDRLIETMRQHYYTVRKEPFHPISTQQPDYRAKRITDYLNLVNRMVQEQLAAIKQMEFKPGTALVQYFEMLPPHHPLKQRYTAMNNTADGPVKQALAASLRHSMQPGNIDVNIMTKVDKDNYDRDGQPIGDGSDAITALRGYANSDLAHSSIIFSAGMNLRLFNYLEKCPQFLPDEDGTFKKKVTVKVSDFRSALVQGKYLAKKGIWVSEFRIESGLNCGGHAFPSDGYLMGPILEEFKQRREELTDSLFTIYNQALKRKGLKTFKYAPRLAVSAQGGIGTAAEDEMLRNYYQLDSTGWGTPFLLVPEATTVDDATLQLLTAAQPKDLVLSHHSPIGMRFFYLNGTTAQAERLRRIAAGSPGSPCSEKHLSFNTEFTAQPICTASAQYQALKIAQLQSLELPAEEYQQRVQEVVDKECLCVGLSNAAALRHNARFVRNRTAVNVCPGPNIVYFNKVLSLREMVDHIYGRANVLANTNRPHVLLKELTLYLDYLEEQLEAPIKATPPAKYYDECCERLRDGILYYRQLHAAGVIPEADFLPGLHAAGERLDAICTTYSINR